MNISYRLAEIAQQQIIINRLKQWHKHIFHWLTLNQLCSHLPFTKLISFQEARYYHLKSENSTTFHVWKRNVKWKESASLMWRSPTEIQLFQFEPHALPRKHKASDKLSNRNNKTEAGNPEKLYYNSLDSRKLQENLLVQCQGESKMIDSKCQ